MRKLSIEMMERRGNKIVMDQVIGRSFEKSVGKSVMQLTDMKSAVVGVIVTRKPFCR
ncbi:hypothetical protein [Enterococcus rotai]|uniref:hypothetical protein n=1 Tax=Enterococcus rotai TaxID=118060 RepID=UPI0032B4D78F